MFELKQLRCFVAVADELHFGRAATGMNMTQSPFSRQIRLLEADLGVQLLDRANRHVRLTPSGRAFLIEARTILEATETMAAATRQTAAGETGSIALGFTTTAGFSLMPDIVMRCRELLPKITLSLREMTSHDQMAALETGQIDVGLVWPPLNPLVCRALLGTDQLVAALPDGDPRLAKPALHMSDFHERPFVNYARDTAGYLHDKVCALFADGGCAPRFIQHLGNAHAMLGMVGSGMGAALVPRAAMRLRLNGVQFRPLGDIRADIEHYAAWNAGNSNTAIVKFLEAARVPARMPRQDPAPPARFNRPAARIAASH